jgi:sulfonate transport system substrate-binding protein
MVQITLSNMGGRKMMQFARAVLASLTAMALCGAPSVCAQQPVKIRLSWVAPVSNWGSIWLEKKDLAKHLGKSYVLETMRFAGTPPMVTALASGELEVASFAYSTLGIAIKNAGMDDLRVIAHEFRDGVAGHYSQEYLVVADGPVKTVEDLKGKVIATNAAGSAVDVATRAMLRKAGLEDKRDYTVVEAPFPAMRAMLAEKKVDMVPGVLPFSLDPELRKIARPIFSQRDAIGETEMLVWAVRQPFIDKNRAALVDFMEDTVRIVRWYLDPANQKAAADIASNVTKQPAERFGWLFTSKDYYRDRDLLPNVDALQKNLDMTSELGFLKGKVELARHVDLSIVKDAAARIK